MLYLHQLKPLRRHFYYFFQVYKKIVYYCYIYAAESWTLTKDIAMGHWGTCPLDFPLFNFSGHFRDRQTLTFDSMWLLIQ